MLVSMMGRKKVFGFCLTSSPNHMKKTMRKMNGLEEDKRWETKDGMSRIEAIIKHEQRSQKLNEGKKQAAS